MSGNPMHLAPRCGARTRNGRPCQAPSIKGKKRCRMHGGRSPGRPPKHGRYAEATVSQQRAWRQALRDLRLLIERTDRGAASEDGTEG